MQPSQSGDKDSRPLLRSEKVTLGPLLPRQSVTQAAEQQPQSRSLQTSQLTGKTTTTMKDLNTFFSKQPSSSKTPKSITLPPAYTGAVLRREEPTVMLGEDENIENNEEAPPQQPRSQSPGEKPKSRTDITVVRGYISDVLYSTPNGAQCVVFTECDIPEAVLRAARKNKPKEKKSAGKSREGTSKKRKRRGTTGSAGDNLFADEEDEEARAEESAIDLNDVDDEDDDDYADEPRESDEDFIDKSEEKKRGEKAKVPVDEDEDEDEDYEPRRKKPTEDALEVSDEESTGSNTTGQGNADNDLQTALLLDSEEQSKRGDKKPVTEQVENEDETSEEVDQDGEECEYLSWLDRELKRRVSKKPNQTNKEVDETVLSIQTVAEAARATVSTLCTPVAAVKDMIDVFDLDETSEPKEHKDASAQKQANANVPSKRQRSEVDATGDVEFVEEKPAKRSKKSSSPDKQNANESANAADRSPNPIRADQTELREIVVHPGVNYKVVGKFAGTSVLLIYDLEVTNGNTSEKQLVRILDVHRAWDGPLTKRKINARLAEVNKCEGGAHLQETLKIIPGKTTDAIAAESLRRVNDPRHGWVLAGALNTPREMKICSAIGVPGFESVVRLPPLWSALQECVNNSPERLLFAEELLGNLCTRAGLMQFGWDDFLRLPEVEGTETRGEGEDATTVANTDSQRAPITDRAVLYSAWWMYKLLRKSIDYYGDTMMSKSYLQRAIGSNYDEAGRYLFDRGCTIDLPDHIALKSVYDMECQLALELLARRDDKRAHGPVNDALAGEQRKLLLDCMREDLAEAMMPLIDPPFVSLIVLDGPEETAVFLLAFLTKMYRKADISTGCFNPKAKHPVPGAFDLPSLQISFGKHLATTKAAIVLLTEAHYAGSEALLAALQSVPRTSKIIVVGDSGALVPIPTKPEFGRPFLGMCQVPKTIIPRSFVMTQMQKTGPELAVESLISCGLELAVRTAADQPGTFEIRSLNEVRALEPVDCVLVSTATDKKEVEASSEWKALCPRKDLHGYRRNDMVAVMNCGREIAAGKLMSVNDSFDDLLAAANGVLHLPLNKVKQITGSSSHVYMNAELAIELSDSGCSGKPLTLNTKERFPLKHIDVAVLKTIPPFKVGTACLYVTTNTTMRDFMAASKIVKNKLIVVGDRQIIEKARRTNRMPASAVAFVLSAAVPKKKTQCL